MADQVLLLAVAPQFTAGSVLAVEADVAVVAVEAVIARRGVERVEWGDADRAHRRAGGLRAHWEGDRAGRLGVLDPIDEFVYEVDRRGGVARRVRATRAVIEARDHVQAREPLRGRIAT